MKKNMSYHAQYQRMDRIMAIVENIGLGEVIAEKEHIGKDNKKSIRKLTSTGIIIVVNVYTGKIITAFPASLEQIKEFYNIIPNWIYKIVKKNSKLNIK